MALERNKLGHVSVFWGNGKGKSTSAFGTGLRACGNGYSVHMVQFMKDKSGDLEIDYPGELKALDQKFDNFTYKRFGTGRWVTKPDEDHKKKVAEAFEYLKQCLENENYDIVIADEILYTIQLGLLGEDEVIELIKNKPKNKELILTGSHKAFPKIFEKADLVTEVKKIRHPYDSGRIARKGIEY